ncbi:glycoside hydrolase [Opitutaceae bacterium TAV5]|nr:glycoside hydrolase [Opitutaceae bacterium TAV5]
MNRPLTFRINGLVLRFYITAGEPVKFTVDAAGTRASSPGSPWLKWARLVELQAAGYNPDDHHGNKYTGTSPADLLRHVSHRKAKGPEGGARLEVVQAGGGLRVVSHFHFIPRQSVFRTWTEVHNTGDASLLLEYASSLAITGLSRESGGRWADKMRLHLPDNNWCGECQWRSGRPGDFGLHQFYAAGRPGFGISRIAVSNQGTWSTAGALPLGVIENTGSGRTHFWQIEHNGSWHWELSDIAGELCLRASGPTWRESLWSERLAPGKTFTSVPVSYGIVAGGLQEALRSLTGVRRAIRRRHPDTEKLPVIFNDYMNCLWANPSEEKLLPLIAKAAEAGCEYFVIDAGWYAEAGRSWWDTVGEWQPVTSRFPRGLGAVIDTIRAHDMVPGLWLEIEVMGIHCPLAKTLPDDWFFQRDGKRVIDHGRYQLDFRNPAVRAHADGIIDRLVADFRIGYLKMDYNINAGPGTDRAADSPGAGLLAHNRAYLEWIEAVFGRHPRLVIENCGSGGLRMDYAMLRLHPLQSVSDQSDYRLNALIAAAAASAVAPEQAAVWSYPKPDGDEEETIFNLVNVLLLRVHQSGCIRDLSTRRFARITEGLALYKKIRADIRRGLPFWPLGLPKPGAGWLAFGLDCGRRRYLAVWRLDGHEKTCTIPLSLSEADSTTTECIYPLAKKTRFAFRKGGQIFSVTLPRRFTARLFRLGG